MKLLLAVLIYLLVGFILAWGIVLAVKGNWWLLAVSTLAYLILFAKIGCLPKSHH